MWDKCLYIIEVDEALMDLNNNSKITSQTAPARQGQYASDRFYWQ